MFDFAKKIRKMKMHKMIKRFFFNQIFIFFITTITFQLHVYFNNYVFKNLL